MKRRDKQVEVAVSKALSPEMDYSQIEYPSIICKCGGRIAVEAQKNKGTAWYKVRIPLLKRVRQ